MFSRGGGGCSGPPLDNPLAPRVKMHDCKPIDNHRRHLDVCTVSFDNIIQYHVKKEILLLKKYYCNSENQKLIPNTM